MKRAVVKVGTAVLTDAQGKLDRPFIEDLCAQLVRARNSGWAIVFVSSGAIRAGAERLQLKRRPQLIPEKQAAAAVGQGLLLHMYSSGLAEHGVTAAQVLLTREDFADRTRYLNARNTLLTLLRFGTLPVINENDTVSIEEIQFGDNDLLAALVATIVDADLVALLTDVEGLCARKPQPGEHVDVIPEVKEITSEIEALAIGGNSERGGTGGMASKLAAAKVAVASGIPLTIAPGRAPDALEKVLKRQQFGTRFVPASSRLNSRKRWIAFALPVRGSLKVNEGAADILAGQNKSLLPVGIVDVIGDFDRGDLVRITRADGSSLARGFVNYTSDEVRRIMGKKTSEIRQALGHIEFDEVIHRDNLVLGV